MRSDLILLLLGYLLLAAIILICLSLLPFDMFEVFDPSAVYSLPAWMMKFAKPVRQFLHAGKGGPCGF